MKEILPLIPILLRLVTPDPDMKDIRLEKKALRLARKKLRIAEKMYKQIRKEFKKDGFTDEETTKLVELNNKINARKMELI